MKYIIKTIDGNKFEVDRSTPIPVNDIFSRDDELLRVRMDDKTVVFFLKQNISYIAEKEV